MLGLLHMMLPALFRQDLWLGSFNLILEVVVLAYHYGLRGLLKLLLHGWRFEIHVFDSHRAGAHEVVTAHHVHVLRIERAGAKSDSQGLRTLVGFPAHGLLERLIDAIHVT